MAYTWQQQQQMQNQYSAQKAMENQNRQMNASLAQATPMMQQPTAQQSAMGAAPKPPVPTATDAQRQATAPMMSTQKYTPMQQPQDRARASIQQQMRGREMMKRRPQQNMGMQNRNAAAQRSQAYNRYAQGMGM